MKIGRTFRIRKWLAWKLFKLLHPLGYEYYTRLPRTVYELECKARGLTPLEGTWILHSEGKQ